MLLENILYNSKEAVVIIDMETLDIIYANNQAKIFAANGDKPYEGYTCHKWMVGRDSQCEFCPLSHAGEKAMYDCMVEDGISTKHVRTMFMEADGRQVAVELITEAGNDAEKTKNRALTQQLEQLQKIDSVLRSGFNSIFLIDTNTGQCSIFKTETYLNPAKMNLPQVYSFEVYRKEYCRLFLREVLTEGYDTIPTLDYILDYLTRTHEPLNIRYKALKNEAGQENFEIIFAPLNKDDYSTIVMGVQSIDKQIELEKQQQIILDKTMADADQAHHELDISQNVINGLSTLYFTLYKMNLKENTYIEIASRQNIRKTLTSVQTQLAESLDMMTEHLVMPPTREAMRIFNDASTMAERIGDKNYISQEFIGITTGWSRAVIIPTERDENGMTVKALYCTQEINAEKERELEHQQKLQAALDEIERENEVVKSAVKAAEQANISKSTFLSNVSHDMRTPLNGIIGMAAIANAHLDEKDRVKDCLDKINDASHHLLALINDVLDLSRIESGKVSLYEKPFTLSELFHNLMNMTSAQVESNHHDLQIMMQDVKHDDVVGDDLRLQQVFMNLLSNAIKYTPDGGWIRVSLQELPSKIKGYALYEYVCEDNGLGMTPEFLEHIFEPFERANDTEVRKISGTGLGMVITRNIVRMMHGDIHVESTFRKGSKFTVTFELKCLDQKVDMNPVQTDLKDLGNLDFSSKHILLAEDNMLNMEIAVEILKTTGVQIDIASDGEEEVRLFQQSPEGYYDLILSDVQMPNMDGHQAARTIRMLSRQDALTVPIVAMSANAFNEDVDKSRSAGMNDHLSKPIELDKLLQILVRYLGM